MIIKKHILKMILGLFICFLSLNLILADSAKAGQFYPNGYARCVSSSGHANIWSVWSYACQKAIEKSQNACATWLGIPGNSHSTIIYAPSVTSVVPVSYWGMCTDRADRLSRLYLIPMSGGGIHGLAATGIKDGLDDPGLLFTRSGSWGSPSSVTTTLDVATFIKHATPMFESGQMMYKMRVIVDRYHSDDVSAGFDFSEIILIIGQPIPKPVIETPETLCKRWEPGGFTGADMWHGTTTVDIRIKNLASRFGNTGYGDWNKGIIYAMPTDEVQWTECYFGGTPGTGQTEVSSVNGGNKYYVDLRSDWCQNSSSGSVWDPGAFYPYRDVGSVPLSVPYYQLWTKVQPWQNQWQIWGAGQVRRSGDSPNGSWSFNIFVNKSDAKRNGYLTQLGQAGQTFTEAGQTGNPQLVQIDRSSPTETITRSYYETPETDYSRPKTCTVNTIFGPIEVTNGDYCGYNTYQLPHYDGYSCTNRYERELRSATVVPGPHKDSASVLIPYNFINYTGVTLNSGEVYAGETVDVQKVWTMTTQRDNAVTKASYATQVPGAQLKLFAYVTADPSSGGISNRTTGNSDGCGEVGSSAKQCIEVQSKSGFTLNPGASLDGSQDDFPEMGGIYNAFDASAGDYICFVSSVFPATSGSDTQMGTGGDGLWRYSSPACVIIAKKPTFQVWGDSLYSVGSINANIGAKRNIYSSYFSSKTNLCKNGVCFGPRAASTPTIYFNSWVEESLIFKNGLTSSVASGAATGLNSNYAKTGTTGEFCKARSPLTFANDCKNNGGTNAMGRSGIDSGVGDRQELIDYWIGSGTDVGSCGSVWGGTCRRLESANNKNIRYVSGGNLSVSGTIPQNTTYLVKASGTVTVGNLRYNTGSYDHIGAIPKVIIYAPNINIACGTSEVDAILITAPGGHVDTCAGGGDENDPARSVQLKIFGTVMTDSITLGRTYGDAANETGSRTDPYGTPSDGAAAEIFDYDSTILMWSEFMSGSGESDTLNTTYQHELAPRY